MKQYAFRIQPLVVLALLLGGVASPSWAGTTTAASCSATDVSSAIASSVDGDTVQIPNGSCTWTTGITMSRQITLQGASVNGVTITHGAGSATLLSVNIGSSQRTQIANLRFMPGTGTGVYIQMNGDGLAPLMHDVYFNIPWFQLQDAVRWFVKGGVIWRATFESTDSGGSDSGCLQIKGASNLPWLAASTLGTLDTNGTNNVYIEDSIFRNVGQCPDVDDQGRVVVRHSQIIGSSGTTHGTTSAQGGRQMELYDNTFSYPDNTRNLNRYFWFRAGAAVITRNSVQKISGPMWGTKQAFVFAVENAQRSGPSGCCTAYMCFHQPGSGANGTSQISDPVYIWANTGTGATDIGTNEGSPTTCGTTHSTTDFFKPNRDYFVENGAKPGYTSYPYPHPLTLAGGGGGTLPAPSNLRIQ